MQQQHFILRTGLHTTNYVDIMLIVLKVVANPGEQRVCVHICISQKNGLLALAEVCVRLVSYSSASFLKTHYSQSTFTPICSWPYTFLLSPKSSPVIIEWPPQKWFQVYLIHILEMCYNWINLLDYLRSTFHIRLYCVRVLMCLFFLQHVLFPLLE